MKDQGQRLTAVLEIGAALSSTRDLDGLLRLTIDRVKGLLGADAATLFMLDAERHELWSRVLVGSTLREIRLSVLQGICGDVVRTGASVLLPDAYGDPRFHPEVDRLSGFTTRSVIAAPLRHVSGRVLGVLEVLHHAAGAFTEDDKALVEAVGTQVAAVLDNVLLYDELRRQNEALRQTRNELSHALKELDLLFEVERSIGSASQEKEVVAQVLEKARAVLQAEAAALLLPEESAGSLYVRPARVEGAPEGLLSYAVKPGQGLLGQVAAGGQGVRAQLDSPGHGADLELAQALQVELRSVLCVPIPMEERKGGALLLVNKAGGFGDADERLAVLLGRQTGRALLARRARVEGEVRAKLAALGQMLSSVVHDFATPMTLISGYSQLLAVEEDPRERARQAEVLDRQVEQLNAMMRETLAFARGERDVLLRQVDFPRFMKEVGNLLRAEFAHSQVKLHLDVQYDGKARLDDGKIKRVIANIARNAIEAMPDGGNFTVTAQREGETLLFRFDDDGPGIPAEIAGRLFESFVTHGKTGGTGLGLAIVKKVVEEHGGQVTCQSAPGKGAHFEVRLPLRRHPEA